jgi:hypothetical protein
MHFFAEVYPVLQDDPDSPVKPTRQYMSSYTSRAKSTKRKASGSAYDQQHISFFLIHLPKFFE